MCPKLVLVDLERPISVVKMRHYHHGIPGISARVTAEQSKPVVGVKYDILAIANYITEFDVRVYQVGASLQSVWCIGVE